MNINFNVGKIVLENDDIILRKFEISDLDDFYEYAKVDGVGQGAGWLPHKSIEESELILDMFISKDNTFAIVDKHKNKVIGSIGIELTKDPQFENTPLRGREFGYVLSKDYRGKGIMKNTLCMLIDYLFNKEDFDFLTIEYFKNNNQSKRVAEKLGFKYVKDRTFITHFNVEMNCDLTVLYKKDWIKNMKKLGFGCMRLPLFNEENRTGVNEEEFCSMIDTFIHNGFTYFDTAYMYHNYTSELFVKKCLVQRYPRSAFTLADKLPTMFLKNSGDLQRFFDEQLEKTGVSYFDYYLLHSLNVANYANCQRYKAFEFCANLRDKGLVKEFGFSFHDTPELLEQILTEHPEVDFVQLQLNYIDWESKNVESRRCYEIATKHHKKIIVMEPIKGGSLVAIPEEAKDLFKKADSNLSIASWAIRYVASLPNVFMVLSGMSNKEQLDDNISYMKDFKELMSEDYKVIDKVCKIINSNQAIACTACRYCVEGCPKKIAIPEYFALFNQEKNSLNKGFSVHQMYYENLILKHGKASDCIKCKLCEKSCPQHLKISELLVTVAKTFE